MSEHSDKLRQQILDLTAQYHTEVFGPRAFVPGTSNVPVSGKVIDAADISAVVDSALDGWFTTGRWAKDFERKLARFVGVRSASLVNSGSSANLVALSALTSPTLKDRQLKPGDEVITVAAGFPTTVNPIFQNRLVPVFIDVTLPTYEIDVTQLEAARSDRTRAVMIAHTLGNVFDVDAVVAFCKKYNLWLVEECCDALGSTYKGQHVGTFGEAKRVEMGVFLVRVILIQQLKLRTWPGPQISPMLLFKLNLELFAEQVFELDSWAVMLLGSLSRELKAG